MQEDMSLNPGSGRYIVGRMTTKNGSETFPSERLKNFRDTDKGSSLSLCLSVKCQLSCILSVM